jgi:hypothetical protein
VSYAQTDPVSVPPRPVVYIVAVIVALTGVAGAAIGFRTGFHNGERPGLGGSDQTQTADTATLAKPIVDLQAIEQQAPVPSNTAQAAEAQNDSNAIAVRTAQAEQVQSKAATSTTSIDDVLASSSEKPQAPAKPSTDEQAPQATSGGGKSDVPF